MYQVNSKIIFACLFLLVLVGCSKQEEARPDLQIPTSYDASAFTANTATQAAVKSQLETLVNETKKARVAGVAVNYQTLTQQYNAGNPSVKGVTTSYFAGRMDGQGNWLDELAKASGTLYTPSAPIAGRQGGAFGGYLFDENGLEIEQLVEKGSFGAALYNHATTLMASRMTPATVDQLLSIFGAHPDFPNTPTSSKATNPDKFMANYAARRDKNDGNGFYSQMKKEFIKLQAATKAGDAYKKEQDDALVAIRLTWEKINAATIINYCHAVIATMSATSTTDAQKGAALHAYGECVGFAHGWRTIPQQYKKITDAQIDEVLVLLNAPFNGTPTSYKFITEPVSELPKLTQVINRLKDLYGFTNQEIEDFKNNWITVQTR
jgi:hypothetical protein